MMSRWGGGEGGCQNVTNTTDRLRECVTKGGRGSKNPEIMHDVIYGWPLIWTRTTLSLMTFWRCLLSKIWSCAYGPFVINLNDSLTMLSIRLDHLHRILLQSLIGMILWRCLVNKMKYEVYIDAIHYNTWLFRHNFVHFQALFIDPPKQKRARSWGGCPA